MPTWWWEWINSFISDVWSHCIFTFYKVYFNLLERQRKDTHRKEKWAWASEHSSSSFQLSIHSPDVCNNLGWAGLDLGAQNSSRVSCVKSSGPGAWAITVARSWVYISRELGLKQIWDSDSGAAIWDANNASSWCLKPLYQVFTLSDLKFRCTSLNICLLRSSFDVDH